MASATYARRYGEAELEAMDPVEVALAQYRVHGDLHDRVRAGRISQILFPLGPPEYNDHRPTLSSPSPPRKRACIPASTNAILGLKEVVSTSTMDGHCAICFKALAAGQDWHDKDATADDDDLKVLLALVGDQDAQEEEEDNDEEEAKVTWLQPLRLRVMPCSHIFHQRCIFKWLSRNAVCPLCHHKLPTVDDDDDKEEEDYEEPDDDDDDDWTTTTVASSCYQSAVQQMLGTDEHDYWHL